jgi:hypothetical protein
VASIRLLSAQHCKSARHSSSVFAGGSLFFACVELDGDVEGEGESSLHFDMTEITTTNTIAAMINDPHPPAAAGFVAFTAFGLAIGLPQCGHVGALSLTLLPQSGHRISAMVFPLFAGRSGRCAPQACELQYSAGIVSPKGMERTQPRFAMTAAAIENKPEQ